jgi:mono/diheme cytochrome c family protein
MAAMNRLNDYRRTVAGAVAIVLELTATRAWPAEDAARGRAVAERWCQECHVISPGHARSRDTATEVPSFMAIAKDPAQSDSRLRGFLSTPHATMPASSALSRQEIDDLVAYFRGLATDAR